MKFLGTSLKIRFQTLIIQQIKNFKNQNNYNNMLYVVFYYLSDGIFNIFPINESEISSCWQDTTRNLNAPDIQKYTYWA